MQDLNIGNGEMLAMHVRDVSRPRNPPSSGGASRLPGRSGQTQGAGALDPETLRLRVAGDPRARADVQSQHPQLAAVIDDPQRWREVYLQVQHQQANMDLSRQREIAALNDDPFNMEAQAKIAEIIRQEAVMENLQSAMEHNPEGRLGPSSISSPTNLV
jgi:DNA damage-inducible protein 1